MDSVMSNIEAGGWGAEEAASGTILGCASAKYELLKKNMVVKKVGVSKGGVFFPGKVYGVHRHSILEKVFFSGFRKKQNSQKIFGRL